MRRVVLMSALVAIVMIGLTPLATGQAQPPQGKPAAGAASQIEGRWAGTIDTPEGTVPSVAELKLDGGVIKALDDSFSVLGFGNRTQEVG